MRPILLLATAAAALAGCNSPSAPAIPRATIVPLASKVVDTTPAVRQFGRVNADIDAVATSSNGLSKSILAAQSAAKAAAGEADATNKALMASLSDLGDSLADASRQLIGQAGQLANLKADRDQFEKLANAVQADLADVQREVDQSRIVIAQGKANAAQDTKTIQDQADANRALTEDKTRAESSKGAFEKWAWIATAAAALELIALVVIVKFKIP